MDHGDVIELGSFQHQIEKQASLTAYLCHYLFETCKHWGPLTFLALLYLLLKYASVTLFLAHLHLSPMSDITLFNIFSPTPFFPLW